MKDTRKIKLGKLNFYIIADNYIRYLSQFDKHIAYNKNESRPYIGVVIIVAGHYYFAPIFSPKPKHKTYKDNISFFKIMSKTKNDLGIIRFSDMIPVPEGGVYLIDVEKKSYGYRRLLSEQYSYINKTENREKIIQKAEKLYNIVTNSSKSKMAKFYKDLSCNFKLLEEKCLEYKE
ncbi:MAG: type III toxin-antitoxin system ToxN/AbiQ family toxin [Clostridiales bacterium]|nr:type III toxin-antitoxin system ToxN/AbiQ family toxin [Clostridiales bacterium]